MSELPLGAFFVDIVAPARTESTFRCLAELADRVFALVDQQAGVDQPSPHPCGVRARYASILYPVGNGDVEPYPVKAVLHQNTMAMQVQQVVIDFQAKTVECEGHANLAIEPEQIECAQEEIKPYLRDVWKKKKAREEAHQLQEVLAWRDFFERLECNGIFPAESSSDADSVQTHRRCPICDTHTTSCSSCRIIMCLNKDCAVSHLVPFQSCSHHISTSTCLSCLTSAKGVPQLGQCPHCSLWFCRFELKWCLGRPRDGMYRPPRNHPRRLPNAAREHPTRPIGCISCIGTQDRPHCSNGKCWSRVGGYTSVCESCSPAGGLWCTCEQCWICDDCKTFPTENWFKECPRCKRIFCIYECEYIQFCVTCGRTTLCDDCVEEEPSAEPDAVEGVVLKEECRASHCVGRICGDCLDDTRCAGCNKTFCSSCMSLQLCGSCDGQFCPACYHPRKWRCDGCDAGPSKA